MTEANRAYIRRPGTWICVGILAVGAVLSAVFLSASLQNIEFNALIGALAVFLIWKRFPVPPLSVAEQGSPVTIRLQLKRTRAIFQRSLVLVDVLWCVMVTICFAQRTTLWQYGLAIGGSLVLTMTASLFVKGQLRCPRCRTDFKQARIAEVGRWSTDTRGAEERWQRCPQCGVDFDDPYRA